MVMVAMSSRSPSYGNGLSIGCLKCCFLMVIKVFKSESVMRVVSLEALRHKHFETLIFMINKYVKIIT